MNEEYDFDLDEELWQQYLEWCTEIIVVRRANGSTPYLSERGVQPSVSHFQIWKQDMKYYTDKVEDE